MKVKLLPLLYNAQTALVAIVGILLAVLYSSPQSYTDDNISPPTFFDKLWFVIDALYYVLVAGCFMIANIVIVSLIADGKDFLNFIITWGFLALFFLIRWVCTLIWAIWGMMPNEKIFPSILFSCLISAIICIASLPYLKKIFKIEKWHGN